MVTCLSYSLCSVCHVRTWHTLGLCHTNFHSLSQLLPLTWNIQSKSPYAKSYFKSVSVTQPLKSDFNQIRKWLYVNIRSVLNYLQWTQLLEDVLIFMDMKYSISFIIIFLSGCSCLVILCYNVVVLRQQVEHNEVCSQVSGRSAACVKFYKPFWWCFQTFVVICYLCLRLAANKTKLLASRLHG